MYLKKFEIAIIGCGYWGTNIVKTLLSLKINKIYCFDKDIKNSNSLKDRFKKVVVIDNLKKIIDDKKIKVVFICVPTSLHYNYAKLCLNNNKNIFVEKPVSADSNKINKLIKLAKKKKARIMSGYIYIYNKYINYIKNNLLKKGFLGKIKYIELNRKNYGPIRNDVSSLWDLASHDLSIVKYFFGDKITKVKHLKNSIIKKNIFDIYVLSFSVKKINVNINVSWLYPEKVRQILIIGSKKILMFDELNIKQPIKVFDIVKKYPSPSDLPLLYFNPQKKIIIKKPYVPTFKKFSPLKNEIQYFLKKILTKEKIYTDAKFALDLSKNLKKFS